MCGIKLKSARKALLTAQLSMGPGPVGLFGHPAPNRVGEGALSRAPGNATTRSPSLVVSPVQAKASSSVLVTSRGIVQL